MDSQEKYSELEAQRVVKTLTEAIGYCHTQFVVHRDLKVRGSRARWLCVLCAWLPHTVVMCCVRGSRARWLCVLCAWLPHTVVMCCVRGSRTRWLCVV